MKQQQKNPSALRSQKMQSSRIFFFNVFTKITNQRRNDQTTTYEKKKQQQTTQYNILKKKKIFGTTKKRNTRFIEHALNFGFQTTTKQKKNR